MSGACDATLVQYLRPRWQAPAQVHAAFTLRSGGVSTGAYAALNLATHVDDAPAAVAVNRQRLRTALDLPEEPAWLTQVHGSRVIDLDLEPGQGFADAAPGLADGACTHQPGRVCAVLVADCLPVLLATRQGDAVGAVHAGWRGLAAGVLEAAVAAFGVPGSQLLAWLGPGISTAHFEVGIPVRAAFLAHDPAAAVAFHPNARGRWQCDLRALARARLAVLGLGAIDSVEDAGECTYAHSDRYFSYRRDGQTGRMAALVWRD